MQTGKRIYVVEDNPDLRALVASVLADYGYQVSGYESGRAALDAISAAPPDLCIVDLGLPDMDGMAVIRSLYGDRRFGMIILTGRAGLSDRVLGLELGADDYIIKPFEPRELVARVSSVLRRTEHLPSPAVVASPVEQESAPVARFADWSYDSGTLTLTHLSNQQQERLSRAEADMLGTFLRSPKRVLSREQLQGDGQDPDDMAFDRAIDVRVSRLRKKLGDDPRSPRLIKTVYGAGYLFASDIAWQKKG